MLRSLINQAVIYLHPDYIAIVRRDGLFKKSVTNKEVVKVINDAVSSDYTNLISALDLLLNKPEWKRCNADIILSGDLTHFRVAKWSNALSTEEHKSLIRHQIAEINGLDESNLHIFMTENGFRKNKLAFSVDDGLLKALFDFERKRLFKIKSINPYFAMMVNYWHQLIAKTAQVIIKDEAYLYYLKFVNNAWDTIRIIKITDNWATEIEKVVSREAMLDTSNNKIKHPIYYHEEKPSDFNLDALNVADTNPIRLQTRLPSEGHYAFKFLNYLR